LTRSHHIDRHDSHRERSWCFLIQNVYRRSLSSDPDLRKHEVFVSRDPQGLRRPRFSFFIFTCQTARDPKAPLPWPGGSEKTPFRRQMTTDFHRLLLHSSKRGASRARKHALACGPMQRRAQWAVYRPARLALSTALSTNRRIIRQNFATQRSRYISGTCAALEPHSCDVLAYS
jgi:hypothetical protein